MPGRISPEVEWMEVCGSEAVGGWFGREGIEVHAPKKLVEGLSRDTRYEVSRIMKEAMDVILFDNALRNPEIMAGVAGERVFGFAKM